MLLLFSRRKGENPSRQKLSSNLCFTLLTLHWHVNKKKKNCRSLNTLCFLLHWIHPTPLTHRIRLIHSASTLNFFTWVGHPGFPLQFQRDGVITRAIQFSLRQMSTIDQMNHNPKEFVSPCWQNGWQRRQVDICSAKLGWCKVGNVSKTLLTCYGKTNLKSVYVLRLLQRLS